MRQPNKIVNSIIDAPDRLSHPYLRAATCVLRGMLNGFLIPKEKRFNSHHRLPNNLGVTDPQRSFLISKGTQRRSRLPLQGGRKKARAMSSGHWRVQARRTINVINARLYREVIMPLAELHARLSHDDDSPFR
jgi:hypothetical protein